MSPPPPLTAVACRPAESRGRRHAEPESPTRTAFQRDRDRVIHSTAFRRLKHKTQVFVFREGDHYRTRLTHSLEVAQIARSVCRALGLNEDLAEALALAHDLGHTPFGHAGEAALHEAMAGFGGFDHNAQTLRVLTRLEARYAEFDGLNLTWEALEGVVKHNGPWLDADGRPAGGRAVPAAIAEYNAGHDLELHTWPGPEAQIAALADDIAYDNHDVDDGLRAGLFTIDQLRDVALVGPVFVEVMERYPGIEVSRLIHESVRRLIDAMVRDLIAETARRFARWRPADAAGVRALGRPLAAFSEGMAANDRALKAFLFERMYRHPRVTRHADAARRVVRALFGWYLGDPGLLPAEWRRRAAAGDRRRTARLVADYIAGMTDLFARAEHDRLAKASGGAGGREASEGGMRR